MGWSSATFYHGGVGTWSPVLGDVNVFPWEPALALKQTSRRMRSGTKWSYRHYHFPRWTIHFLDVGSTTVNKIGSYLSDGTSGFGFSYGAKVYWVLPPDNYVFHPRCDGPDSHTFDLLLESVYPEDLEIMSS